MDLKFSIEHLFQYIPQSVALIIGVIILGVTLIWKIKQIVLDEKRFYLSQIDNLLHQIEVLSDELDKTRKQLNELHEQNVELMIKLREANQKIDELEGYIKKCYQSISIK